MNFPSLRRGSLAWIAAAGLCVGCAPADGNAPTGSSSGGAASVDSGRPGSGGAGGGPVFTGSGGNPAAAGGQIGSASGGSATGPGGNSGGTGVAGAAGGGGGRGGGTPGGGGSAGRAGAGAATAGASGAMAGARGTAGATGAGGGSGIPNCTVPVPVSFKRDVQPFLIATCGGDGGCHVVDAASTTSNGGFNHGYDWITAGSHASSCPATPNPKRFEVTIDVINGANPASCSRSRKMPPPNATGAGLRAPLTACQIAILTAWLAEPLVVQMHRADDSSLTTPYAMPPFN